jgi:hypothetical protein
MTDPNDDTDIRPHVSKAIDALLALIDDSPPSEYERKLLYDALEQIPWLAPKIRYAINEELDSSADEVVIEQSPKHGLKIVGRRRYSTRAKNEERQQVHAIAHYWAIEAHKARMKKEAQRPRGGAHEAAYAQEARKAGMTVTALKALIKRHVPKGERRETLKESARQSALREQGNLGDKF